jgi:hypothetical protein
VSSVGARVRAVVEVDGFRRDILVCPYVFVYVCTCVFVGVRNREISW